MTKHLLTIEFRYHDAPSIKDPCECYTKTATIGIYDTIEDAIKAGNEQIGVLANHFEVRSDDKFMLNFLFGAPKTLVTNTCYTTKGIAYFAKITKLDFADLNETINECFKAFERYKDYKTRLEDED